ncbi:RNA polymerase sigma factor, sigma-70 family [Roseateles sp. YR242]|uniref:RNA polymerase sigma factor n=1 Tax=Roseateles sp. YR242 TaxID=1855305 RepID=UPI0008C09CC4|nr:sigma-70 family RNA polymerase sigma factor [Roseateles sp. YR242]SEK35043.1 RNA polymerase sigma factor, sigma-70 family [Roseateles sp. YR242]
MRLGPEHESILAAAHRGDPAALDQLLRITRPDIRRYAQMHCRISDVDDAVQETLLIVARRLPSLRALPAFSAWLFRLVQRECRRLGRKAMDFDPYDEERLEHWLVKNDETSLRLQLVAALQALPAHYREVILLRDFEGWRIGEIAELTGLSCANVKSRLHRARSLAREHLLPPE